MNYIRTETENYPQATQHRVIFNDGTRGSVIVRKNGQKDYYKKSADEPSQAPEGLNLDDFTFEPFTCEPQPSLKVQRTHVDSETGAIVGFDFA